MANRRLKDGREIEYGPSLAKGPALIVGAILTAFGLLGLLTNSSFPNFSNSFPDATVNGNSWLGFEVNGWTNFFCIAAGALLLFGAAQHWMAKTMSLVVGLALAACGVIAFIDGHDVLGLAAANFWTKLGFVVAGGVLLVNALMPRIKHEREAPGSARDGIDDTADDRHRRFSRTGRRTEARRPVHSGTTDSERTTDAAGVRGEEPGAERRDDRV